MKKTLLALTVAALAAGSAQAYKFEIQETGTEIDFNGSLRLKWENTNSKVTNPGGTTRSKTIEHQAVRNNGSRFGFQVKQNLGGDFYALGAVQWRMRGDAQSQHDFDHIYTRQLYAGFGHKQYGELVYGNMTTITDSVKQTDLPNTYSLSDGLLDDAARRVVQYTYKGDYGDNKVKFGVYYGGSSKRSDTNLDLDDHRKNVWGTGLILTHKIDDLQSLTFGTGFTRERFANALDNSSYSITAYAFDTSYRFDHTVLGLDLERRVTKDQLHSDNLADRGKITENEARAVVLQEMNEDWNIYAMFAYKTRKLDGEAATEKKNQVMLGTEYYVYKDNIFKVKPFVEGQVLRTRNLGYSPDVKQRDYKGVVGLRIYW